MSRRILRSALAILAGCVVIDGGGIATMIALALFDPGSFQLGAQFPTGWLVISLLVWLLWSVAGGFVTGAVARRWEMQHAIGLVLAREALYVWYASRYGSIQTVSWYTMAGYILLPSATFLGGWLRMKQAVVLQRMPHGLTGTVDSLRLSVAITIDQFRFPVALLSSVVTFFVAVFLGYLLWGIGFLAIQRLVDVKHWAGVVVGVTVIVCFVLPFVPARRVFRTIMTVDTSLIKSAG